MVFFPGKNIRRLPNENPTPFSILIFESPSIYVGRTDTFIPLEKI